MTAGRRLAPPKQPEPPRQLPARTSPAVDKPGRSGDVALGAAHDLGLDSPYLVRRWS